MDCPFKTTPARLRRATGNRFDSRLERLRPGTERRN
jgi:hypothetical protein